MVVMAPSPRHIELIMAAIVARTSLGMATIRVTTAGTAIIDVTMGVMAMPQPTMAATAIIQAIIIGGVPTPAGLLRQV
jgi:hypothetical protein